MKSTLLSRPGRTMLQSLAANSVRALIAVFGLFGFSIASAVTPLVMDSPADILHYTNTPWSLQKTGSFTAVQNPGTGTMNWTVTVTKGTTTSHLTVYGYIEITNNTTDPVPLRNVIIALRKLDGTLVSADIADTVNGDAATQAVVDPAFSFLGESLIQENAGSDALLFRDTSNAPVQLNSPALVFAPGQTKRLYYTAQFNNSALNLAPGTPLYLETMVNMPLDHLMPTLLGLAEITVPAPVAANASVTLLDTTLTTTGTVTVGSFAGLNQLLNQAAAFNISVPASGGANGGTVCNTATLTSTSTTVGTLNGAPIVIPGVNLSAQDCDDIPKIPGPRPITTTITSCSQVVTYDASLFESPNGPIVSATFNPPSGTTFPFGTTPVTFNVTDSLGISATGTLYVTVLDTDAPVITPVSNIVVSADAGQCNAVVTYTTTADDCNLESVTFSPASGSTFPIGTTTVTITAKDKVGHQSISTFTVTVNDTTAPVLSVSNFQASATTENCGANVNFSATYQDCSAVTLIYSLSPTFSPAILPGASFPLGTTTVYVKATDAAGNSSTSSFTVTVVDDQAPVIMVTNVSTSAATETCNANVTFNATATDCSAVTLIYSLSADFSSTIASGASFPIGTTTVYVKATDAAGNSATSSFTVTVVDDTAPVLTATDIQASVGAGTCEANVTFNATATDCSAITYVYSLNASFSPAIASGASFPVGTTTVYVKATDAHGNSSTKTFTVTVVDDKAPVISVTNIQTTIAPGTCAANVTFNATATDCSTYTLVYSLNSSFSPTISSGASFPIGTTTVYVKATDLAGNSSTSSFTVTVVDNQGPVITATNIQTAAAPGTCGANITFNATAADCSGATLIYSLSATFSPAIASGANFPVGTTTVYVKATDSFGNVSTSSFTVTVQDTQPPTITSPLNNLTIQPDAGQCYATFNYTPAAADNCAGTVTVSVSPASGTQLPAGTTTTITVTATDSAGNVTTRTFTVTVGVCLGKLGNFVWKDLDNDGVQDAGEPGVDGVKVTLYTSGGVQVGSPVLTSGGGFYLFDNLIPGDYYVIFDKTTLPAGYVFTTQNTGTDATDSDANATTGKSEGNATVVAGGYNDTVDAGIIIPTAPCVPATLTFSGSSAGSGTAGNIRTYSINGTSVKVSAFSRTKGASGAWNTAFLGVFSGGLGVTDGSEDGNTNSHTVDNVGRDNYVLFEFSQPVVINRAYLGYVVTDSDLTAWVGNIPNAYNNHVTLSDTVLSSLVREQNAASNSSTRWATLNGGQISGNVLIISADVFDTTPDDYFKIAALDICAPAAPLSLACVSVSTGTVGAPFSSALVASGGKSPYTYSIVGGSLPGGLTLNASTGAITGTPTAAGTFNFTAKVTDASSGVAQTATVNCAITITAPPVCVPSTFTFSGNTAGDGADGNTRTFTINGITVKATAFSRTSGGSWATGYVGAYSGGLGVTDSSEDGNSNSHTVDNVGRDNFVLFAFSQPVVVNRAYLGYVVGDSDLTAWVGNISNAYSSNIMLSDSVLGSLATEENLTDSNKPRWAKINAGGISGNVLVVAAGLSDDTPDDYFKIAALDICQPTTSNPVTLGCVSTDSGKVGVAYSSSLRAAGGTPGYTFSIVSGSLPPGLSLNTSTGAITGTPTTAGSFSFTAKVVDSTGQSGTHTATQNCCITIAPSSTSATGKIGSLVWKDKDGDGIQDAGEPGISGITVQLKNSSGTVIKTDVTDSEGVYEFTGLTAGSYTVVVSTPSGYTKSPSNVGSNRAIDSNGSPASVTLSTNTSVDLTIDFGFVPSDYCPKPLVTFTQGGWGSTPKGNNPGSFLTKNFSAVYPHGFVAIGTSSKYLAFTSASAVINFLPQGGTAGRLSSSAVNPTSSAAGVLAGQLLAATLNVDFSNAGRTASGLAAKRVGAGPLKGKTVAEVIALADSVIAGGALPSGLTLSGLNDTLTGINENYDNGDNNGYLY